MYTSSSLTFSLDPGWAFVETEDWRPDLETVWAECGGDASESFVFFVNFGHLSVLQ
jgi:hypothetical protein